MALGPGRATVMTVTVEPSVGRASVPPTIPRAGRSSGPRELLVWAAVELFTEVGYHGTSVRDIGERARVSSTSLYHYFRGKEELLGEIMTSALTEVLGMTTSALATVPADRPDLQLAALVRAWIDFHTRRRVIATVSATELRSLGSAAREPVLALRDEQERVFRDVVERGVDAGFFHTPYPREATRAVIQMGRDVSAWYLPTGQVPATDIAEQYVVLALALVRSPAGPTPAREGQDVGTD